MSLLRAVEQAGFIPDDSAVQKDKKAYSERLSGHLADQLARGLRSVGFANVKPDEGGRGEKAFQGGLGPKKVDVSYADERHGLILAVSIKTINFAPFGKNLRNRFADLCTEAITLHMRFPYSVVCALFAFPVTASKDVTTGRAISTFERARQIFATVSGRDSHVDPGEKFENVTMMLYQPLQKGGEAPWLKLVDALTGREMSEQQYLELIRQLHDRRNPHFALGE